MAPSAGLPSYRRNFHACGGVLDPTPDDKQGLQGLQIEIKRCPLREEDRKSPCSEDSFYHKELVCPRWANVHTVPDRRSPPTSGAEFKHRKELAAFDPFIMFRRPTEVALRHFDILYSTFLLRSCVTTANESTCRDEYVGLIDYLRNNYASDFDVTQHFRDLIDFLMSLEYMQNHSHLIHLFKLCCLCATSCSPDYLVVSMGTLSTSGFQSRSVDVVLPVQSYLSGVSGSLASCVTDRSLNDFSVICFLWPVGLLTLIRSLDLR